MLPAKGHNCMRTNPLEDLEALLDQFDQGLAVPTDSAVPVDLIESEDAYLVVVDLPGFETEDLEVTFGDGRLVIEGERTDAVDADDEQYIRRERRHKTVHRTVTIPGPVADEDISATHEAGVLTVHLPKATPDVEGKEIDIE